MEICIYFKSEKLSELIDGLRLLKIRKPISVGDSEKRLKKDVSLDDNASLNTFLEKNSVGFFMHGQGCLYDVSLSEGKYSVLHIYPTGDITDIDWAIAVFETIQGALPQFGYVSTSEEFKHRNRLVVNQGNNNVESWVGRDLNKYIPGLYSITLLSNEQLDEKKVDINSLKRSSQTYTCYENFVLFTFSKDIEQWSKDRDNVDSVCLAEEGVFSKQYIEEKALKTSNFIELNMLTSNWK